MLFGGRKIYLIRKDLQLRFILRFVVVAAIWAVTTVALFAYLAGKKLDDLRYSSHFDLQTASELLLPITVGVHAISLLVFAGILAYTIRRLWRKFSPPLAALKNSLAGMAGGDLTKEVRLRKEDEFQDLALELDMMRSALRDKIIRIKERQPALSVAAVELNTAIVSGKRDLARIATLQSAAELMKGEVNAFHDQADASDAKDCVL